MLYSVGKDSAVMLHLAMKAFYPSKPPFPLLHVDTTWKFREMYEACAIACHRGKR
jgi:sulfate adenylyltransferase subunit 2